MRIVGSPLCIFCVVISVPQAHNYINGTCEA